MSRPVTLFTAQWADIPLETLAPMVKEMGYDGVELACWGDHMDVDKAARSKKYCKEKHELLADYGLCLHAISHHLAGQLVCDLNNDGRSDIFAPPELAGDAEGQRKWAIRTMKNSARAAKNMGVKVVNGFTGSSIWHLLYSFPPVSPQMVEDGFTSFAKLWNPILDVFDECGVSFALEVHPTEIAYDIVTARRALKAVKNRKAFGFNFDPSHLQWQGVDPVRFLKEFPNRIYHVHMKDTAVTLDGESSLLASHLNFGTPGRGWDFRSMGRGDVQFEEIIRTLNAMNYTGPLSVEWEDAMMDRVQGATESCAYVRRADFTKSDRVFDEAFDH